MKNKSNNMLAIIAIGFVAIVMLVMVINTILLIKPMNEKNISTTYLEATDFKVKKGLFSYKYTINISGYDKPIFLKTSGKDTRVESIIKDNKKFAAVLNTSDFKKLGTKPVAIWNLAEYSKVQNSADIAIDFSEYNKIYFLRLIFFGTIFFVLLLTILSVSTNFVRKEE